MSGCTLICLDMPGVLASPTSSKSWSRAENQRAQFLVHYFTSSIPLMLLNYIPLMHGLKVQCMLMTLEHIYSGPIMKYFRPLMPSLRSLGLFVPGFTQIQITYLINLTKTQLICFGTPNLIPKQCRQPTLISPICPQSVMSVSHTSTMS